ncbi:cation diffusion facilitator family transporter [Marinobacter sp. SS8-8]|uniref:cation diffusion facilitator family transporter n=1 Tax=Marinobacter sp. SS8-8 TaxID=3050452 RepID=UPI0026DFAD8D|nr:cation diffusion facilitator family transporter [Marinobacter sp. SS8-8]|tara:strand:- start:2285 stop:3244 length:960 start_codon:yes stop_codon:yes gene_type:complete
MVVELSEPGRRGDDDKDRGYPSSKHGGGTSASRHKGSLEWTLAMTGTFLVVEVIGGLWTGSLALLADAAHMATDVGGLFMALVAVRFAERPATPQMTYGFVRTEVLSALVNAVVLLLVTAFVLREAYLRLSAPPEILGGPMLAVAVVGLIVNLISMRILHAGSQESLNLKGAYFEVLADMLGSVGVILAALVVLLTGWTIADPIIGAAIGLFIVPRTWILLKGALRILLEGAPAHIDAGLLRQRLIEMPGVTEVHDLHVWSLTSGLDAMSGHLVVDDMARAGTVLAAAREAMHEDFGITHATIQIEDAAAAETEEATHA